ncbi:chromatin associated protein [Camillea tinctor]|nr:chromatin associated protein [Camillea tinctor]
MSSKGFDVDEIPACYKVNKDDWSVVFNPRIPRRLDVNLVRMVYIPYENVVVCLKYSADGNYVTTGSNHMAHIFNLMTGEKVFDFRDSSVDDGGSNYIRAVCFSPDGKYLVTGSEKSQIRVWDIQSKTICNIFSGPLGEISALEFASDGHRIASGGSDNTVRIWDNESGCEISTFAVYDYVRSVAISPNAKYIAAGSEDNTVRVWNIATGSLVGRFGGPDSHKDGVYSVAFSPTGEKLISGSLDKTIKLWKLAVGPEIPDQDIKGGECISTFYGHRDFVLSVAATPDVRWIISGSKDHRIHFWDQKTGDIQFVLQGHKNTVLSVALSPTGRYFATTSGDMRLRIWSYTYLD